MFVVQSLNEVREQTEKCLKEYNEERPHESLGNMTPREFLVTHMPEVCSYEWIWSGEHYKCTSAAQAFARNEGSTAAVD